MRYRTIFFLNSTQSHGRLVSNCTQFKIIDTKLKLNHGEFDISNIWKMVVLGNRTYRGLMIRIQALLTSRLLP